MRGKKWTNLLLFYENLKVCIVQINETSMYTTVKNNCKLTGFLACKITSFGRFSIITVFFL